MINLVNKDLVKADININNFNNQKNVIFIDDN